MEKERGRKTGMKVIIYKSEIGNARIMFETNGTLMLESDVTGTIPTTDPDKTVGGGYSAREIAEGWLNGERLTGMAGSWVHDEVEAREERTRAAMIKWLEGVK